MVASYVTEMALGTAFVVGFLCFLSIRAFGPGPRRDVEMGDTLDHNLRLTPGNTRLWNALQTSVGIFWDTALLFAGTVTIAGIVVAWDGSSTYYTKFFASLSSDLATAVVIAVWPLYLPTCRHMTVRWTGLCLVCMANVSIATSYWLTGPDSTAKTRDIHLSYEWTCLSMGTHHKTEFWPDAILLAPAFISSLIPMSLLLGYLVIVIVVFVRYLRGEPRPARDSPVVRFVSVSVLYLLPAVSLTMFTLMWVSLSFLIKHRKIVAEVAGPSLQEGEWSFGQIMAVATWLPTALDFVVIWKGEL